MDKKITPQDVVGRDPFGQLLTKLNLKPWQVALISLSFFLIYMLVFSIYFDVLLPKIGLERSSSVDRVNQVGFWIIHPSIIFFYVWQPAAIANLYEFIFSFVPVSINDNLIQTSQKLHQSKYWLLGILTGGIVVYVGVIFIKDILGMRWYSINWLMAGILQVSRFFLFYMIVIVFIRHLIVAFNLNRIYRYIKFPVMIAQSKHNLVFDMITSYGLSFVAFGAVLGFFIALRNFYGTPVFPEDLLYLVIYIILMPMAFVLPFWQAHINMQSARQEALKSLSDKLQDEYDSQMLGIMDKKGSDKINMLRALLELTEKAPVWPFQNWAFYRVLAATALPFFMTGLGYLIDSFL